MMMVLAPAAAAQQSVLARLEPKSEVVIEFLADTDGDGRAELVLVAADGQLDRHGLRAQNGGSAFAPMGTLRLRDPAHSLLACRDIGPAPGLELVVADSRGTVWLPWPDANGTPEPRSLARAARFLLRIDRPLEAPFVQDLDHDGRLDLLLPTLQGCTPFLQQQPADGATGLEFRALAPLSLPVQVNLDASNGTLDDEHQMSLVIPQVETVDLNGDGRPDLLTHDGDKYGFHLQRASGGFGPPIEVDVMQFRDSTPSAVMAPGSTLVLGDKPMLQRGDVDGDGIPDFVIAHRRKVWTLLATTAGPQFTKARTQAVADDVSGMFLIDLDEDRRADLLSFQVQLPGIGSLLLGLVQSIDIDIKAVGYRSEGGAFANIPAWRRTVTLRIPPLLSLLSKQEEIVQRFLGILSKARQSVRGAFVSQTANDVALVSTDGALLELFPMTEAPTLGSAAGRRKLRDLLFDDPDPVFDIDRVFGLISGLLDQRAASLTGDAKSVASIQLRDRAAWRLLKLLAANLDGTRSDEVVAVYENVATPALRAYDVLTWNAAPR
ncbi:MAG TPA: VCBS repeat-containing protein [Planctomycetota bacterium]|nr:VCBS repeat-containing protein [Planctomycetota bacterium]